jgi:hypothetical protein
MYRYTVVENPAQPPPKREKRKGKGAAVVVATAAAGAEGGSGSGSGSAAAAAAGGRPRALELAYWMWVEHGLKHGGGWDNAVAEALAEVDLELSLGLNGAVSGETNRETNANANNEKDVDAPPALIGEAYGTAMAAAALLPVDADAFESHALAHAAALGAEGNVATLTALLADVGGAYHLLTIVHFLFKPHLSCFNLFTTTEATTLIAA